MCGEITGHFAPCIRHEAGVGRVVAALREVAAQAGLEVGAGVVLVVSAAACQVIPPDEFEHVGGELVERDHGGRADGSYVHYGEQLERLLLAVGCVMDRLRRQSGDSDQFIYPGISRCMYSLTITLIMM